MAIQNQTSIRNSLRTNKTEGFYALPDLPFAKDALEPHISSETLEFRHDKHHKSYVEKLNLLIQGTGMEGLSIEEVIKKSDGELFNNAAQAWNHSFFWNYLSPDSEEPKNGELLEAVTDAFDSIDEFKEKFSKQANELFGSGWVWLVKGSDGQLEIQSHKDGDNPLIDNLQPILACDVWEHAYYIDYRNVRKDYVKSFWNVVNWDFVASQFASKH